MDIAPGLVHESGPALALDWRPERIAVMAHWATDPEPTRSVATMLRELDGAGYSTVLVSAAEVDGPLGSACTWAPGGVVLPDSTTILRRVNVGYDFGSWAAVLWQYPGVRRASEVLLVNDSLIGPFTGLATVLDAFATCPAPVWGLASSLQHRPHIQSYFMGYRDGVLDSPAMRTFWSRIRVETRKAKTVRYNELALSEVLDDASIPWRALFAPDPAGPPNPTIQDWEALLERGFPFVKRELATAHSQRAADWLRLSAAVQRTAHAEFEAWMPPGARAPAPVGSARRRLSEQVRVILDVEGVRGLWAPVSSRRTYRALARRAVPLASRNPPADVPPRVGRAGRV